MPQGTIKMWKKFGRPELIDVEYWMFKLRKVTSFCGNILPGKLDPYISACIPAWCLATWLVDLMQKSFITSSPLQIQFPFLKMKSNQIFLYGPRRDQDFNFSIYIHIHIFITFHHPSTSFQFVYSKVCS